MSSTRQTLTSCRIGLVAIVMLVLAACSNGGNSGPTQASSPLAIAGSVGDGPVVNAAITVEDSNGQMIGTTTSDAAAKYLFEIPIGTSLPVVIRASGGTDMVSGRELDFELVAVANVNADSTVNLTPQTTLTVATARCLDNDLTTQGLKQTWQRSRNQIGLGMNAELLADPMTQTIDAENAANVVLATEALAEIVRRTISSLEQGSTDAVDADSIIAELGCDLAFGGKIDGYSAQGVMRSGAAYRAAEAAVMLEVISGDLQVGGASANALLDQAVLAIIEPGMVAPSVTEVPLEDSLVNQALESLLLVQSLDSTDAALLEVVDVLVESQPAELRARMRSQLGVDAQSALVELGANLANADGLAARNLATASRGQTAQRAPYISLTAENVAVVQGQSTRVSWASSSADRCLASGATDWEGPVSLSGRYFAENLQHSTQFELRCYGAGGTNRASIKVLVSSEGGQFVADPVDVAFGRGSGNTRDGGSDNGATDNGATDRGTGGNLGGSKDGGTVAGGTNEIPKTESPVPVPAPGSGLVADEDDVSISLRASASGVPSGEFVTLNWSSSNADSCVASRGWDGAQGVSGSTKVGPLSESTSFELTCSGSEGSTKSLVTVNLENRVTVAWKAPAEYTDGSPISGLSGYRIFYGATSGSYSDDTFVADPQATNVELDLAPGSYFMAMSAVTATGIQSALSNEVVITSR